MYPSSTCSIVRIPLLVSLVLLVWGAAAAAANLFVGQENIPADAVVLFDGSGLSKWQYVGSGEPAGWILKDDYMQVHGGSIRSRAEFKDFQLHVEFWLPLMADCFGQARANSGVYLQGAYEIQVLDSYGVQSGKGDCGAIYGVAAPMANACRPPETWQSFDVLFRAPRFDADGQKIRNARVSVLQNGIWIHHDVEIPGPTGSALHPGNTDTGPIMLQAHGAAVRYRNIWVRPVTWPDEHED